MLGHHRTANNPRSMTARNAGAMYKPAINAMTSADMRAVQSAPVFRGLGDTALGHLLCGAWRETYSRQAIIVEPDSAPAVAFLLHRGRARVGRASPEGEEVMLRVLLGGDVYSPAGLGHGEPTKDLVRAMVDRTVVYHIVLKRLQSILRSRAELALQALRLTEESLGASYDRIEQLRFQSVKVRLARLLAERADAHTGTVPDTHDDLAADVGACRDQVGRVLRQFASEGLIRSEKHRHGIVVVDPEHLLSLVLNAE